MTRDEELLARQSGPYGCSPWIVFRHMQRLQSWVFTGWIVALVFFLSMCGIGIAMVWR